MSELVGHARRLMPDVGIQVPPNLSDWWADSSRGSDRPRRTERQRRSHLARAPVPVAGAGAQGAPAEDYVLSERLCVYPEFIDQEWIAQGVLDVIKRDYWSFIPRRGSGRRGELRSVRTSRASRSSGPPSAIGSTPSR